MSRHKLTSSRHALQAGKKTYQDETGVGGQLIISPVLETGTADGDSYIYINVQGDGPPIHNDSLGAGVATDWYDDAVFSVGSSSPENHSNYSVQHALLNFNLFSDGILNANSQILSANLFLTVATQTGNKVNGSIHMDRDLVTMYRNKQTLTNVSDTRYAWWENYNQAGHGWGTDGATHTGSDIDTTVTDTFYLQPNVNHNYTNGEGVEPWAVMERVGPFSVMNLVQDAVENRSGILNSIWIKENDTTRFKNTTRFFSTNSPTDGEDGDQRPHIIIDYYNP